jgi:chemotaxis protein MotA
MKIILGSIIIIVGFSVALMELNQTLENYWDLVAFAMVFSGTLSVAILTSPSHRFADLMNTLSYFFKNRQGQRKKFYHQALAYVTGEEKPISSKKIYERILSEGDELILLGVPANKIIGILEGRQHKWVEDKMKVVNWVRSLAKYPPAFGLAATVLGLIQVMNSLSDSADPRETALKMALALIATFYGIIVANLIVAPIGDRLKANVLEEYHLSEVSMKAIKLMIDGEGQTIAREILASHLDEGQQYKITTLRAA